MGHTSALVAPPQSHTLYVAHDSTLPSAVCHPWQTTFWNGEELRWGGGGGVIAVAVHVVDSKQVAQWLLGRQYECS